MLQTGVTSQSTSHTYGISDVRASANRCNERHIISYLYGYRIRCYWSTNPLRSAASQSLHPCRKRVKTRERSCFNLRLPSLPAVKSSAFWAYRRGYLINTLLSTAKAVPYLLSGVARLMGRKRERKAFRKERMARFLMQNFKLEKKIL